MPFGVFASVVVLGSLGYVLIEGWGPFDSLYMTVITHGRRRLSRSAPLTPVGQMWTMFVIVAGVGALGFTVVTLSDFMVEGHFSGLLEGRRMEKRIAGMTGHHVIAGLGRVGSVVAEEFGIVTRGDGLELKLEQIQLTEDDPFVDLTIGAAHIRSTTGVFVLAAHAADGTVKTNSSPESVLRVDDRLVLFGTEERLRTFASRACADPAVCYPDYRL